MTDDIERTVHTIPRNADEELRATLHDYKGSTYCSLRIFWRNPAGTWCATRKGVSIAAEKLDQLEQAVRALRRAVDGAR